LIENRFKSFFALRLLFQELVPAAKTVPVLGQRIWSDLLELRLWLDSNISMGSRISDPLDLAFEALAGILFMVQDLEDVIYRGWGVPGCVKNNLSASTGVLPIVIQQVGRAKLNFSFRFPRRLFCRFPSPMNKEIDTAISTIEKTRLA
jgi:hypothetical protein